MIIMTALVVLIPWLITVGDPMLPVIAIFIGMAFTVIIQKKDKQTLRVDERIQLIHGKTSTLSLNLFLLGTTIAGLILITLSYSGCPDFSPMGYTLLYSNCALLVLNLILGAYFRRRYGG